MRELAIAPPRRYTLCHSPIHSGTHLQFPEPALTHTLRLAIAASLMSGTSAHAAIFIENFENYTTTATYTEFSGALTPIGSFVPNWLIGGSTTVDVVSIAGLPSNSVAQHGNYWLDLNGTASAGTITRYVGNLTSGQEYQVSFDYAANIGGGAATSPGFTVNVNGASSGTFSNGTGSFMRGAYTFTAGPNMSASIMFASTGPVSSFGPALDNISVAAVPEPHEWAMMLAGLGLVAWAVRRRGEASSDAPPMGATA